MEEKIISDQGKEIDYIGKYLRNIIRKIATT